MSTELNLMTPTGQVVDLSKPEEVAIAYDDLQHLKTLLREAEGRLRDALIAHSKDVGKKSFEIAGVAKVEVKGGTEKKFDALGLKRDLLAAGCPKERVSEIVRETIEYKVLAVEARQAGAANEDYAAAIEKNTTLQEKALAVSVSRIGGSNRGANTSPARRTGSPELTAQSTPSPTDEDVLIAKLPWE